MNRSRIYRAFDEFLKDSNLSLRAKGFLTMALTNNITQGLDVEKYCTDSKEDIKDTLQQEPGEADEESFESLLTDESAGRTLDATGYKNPTSAWEPIDDGRFIFLENKDGYGYVDSIAIKGNHLFVNSNLYRCYSDGNYT